MRAYTEAMRRLQDEYYEGVGIPCGLTREGPKRRRLSRKEWIIEQKAAERLAKAESRIEQIQSAVRKIKAMQVGIRNKTDPSLTKHATQHIEHQNKTELTNTYNNNKR